MPLEDSLDRNVTALKTFWDRRSFHDMAVESIERCNGRVLVKLDEYILALAGAKGFTQTIDEFPTSWISHVIEGDSKLAKLTVCVELGNFECKFTNLRLIRRSDYAILVPAVDPIR